VHRIVRAHPDRIKSIEKLVTLDNLPKEGGGNKEKIARRVAN